MRILHVHNEIENRGGTEVYLTQLQGLLTQNNHESYWISIVENSGIWKWIVVGGDWQTGSRTLIIANLVKWIKQNRIEIICLHNLFDSVIINALLKLSPVVKFSHSPVIVCPGRDKFWRFSEAACTRPFGLHCFYHAYSQGCANRHPKRLVPAYKFVKEELARSKHHYKKIVVMSDYNCKLLLECGIPRSSICVNPYFTLRNELSTQTIPETKQLLFIGRLIRGKGLFHMIAAVEQILLNSSDVNLEIIGDGPLMGELSDLVASKNLTSRIKLVGWRTRQEIEKSIACSYLLIFPSTYPESFGISGIEALMAGKPVVGFDVGGVSTWLQDGHNGILVPAGDVDAMKAGVSQLLNNKELYENMCVHAKESAMENFLPEIHLRKLNDVFSEIVYGRQKEELI